MRAGGLLSLLLAIGCGNGGTDGGISADLTVSQDLIGADLAGTDAVMSDLIANAPADLSGADLTIPTPFACGNTLTCAGDEICLEYIAGVPPDMTVTGSDMAGPPQHTFKCQKAPTACVSDKSCTCLEQNGGTHQFCQLAFGSPVMCYGGGNFLICGAQ